MTNPAATCSGCGKREALCICAQAEPVEIKTKVLILQHPQEPKEDLSTAPLIRLVLPNSVVRTGLSWPNLAAAAEIEPHAEKRWGVLFLGTVKNSAELLNPEREVSVLNPKGTATVTDKLEGIVALDGNWRQAKALWWRNPWLLKLNRIVLTPKQPSLYGKLRREPRKEALSTLEAVALVLAENEQRPDAAEALRKPFRALLEKYAAGPGGRRGAPGRFRRGGRSGGSRRKQAQGK